MKQEMHGPKCKKKEGKKINRKNCDFSHRNDEAEQQIFKSLVRFYIVYLLCVFCFAIPSTG